MGLLSAQNFTYAQWMAAGCTGWHACHRGIGSLDAGGSVVVATDYNGVYSISVSGNVDGSQCTGMTEQGLDGTTFVYYGSAGPPAVTNNMCSASVSGVNADPFLAAHAVGLETLPNGVTTPYDLGMIAPRGTVSLTVTETNLANCPFTLTLQIDRPGFDSPTNFTTVSTNGYSTCSDSRADTWAY